MKVKKNPANKSVIRALELDEQGQRAEAIKLFKRVLMTAPTDWMALFSLGRIQLAEGMPEDAVKLLQRLVSVYPAYAPGFDLWGLALEKLGRHEGAIDAYKRSLLIDPKNADTFLRLGALLSNLDRDIEAAHYFGRGLEVAPNDQMILSNLAKALYHSKRNREAGVVIERLLEINPNYLFAKGLRALNKAHLADWADYEHATSSIVEEIRAGIPSCVPLAFMSMSHSAVDNLQCARMYAAHFYPAASEPVWRGQRYTHDKLRIAYFSGDFREHPVGQLLAGVIERHDKSRFEVIGISFGAPDGSDLRRRYELAFDRFIDVSALGNYGIRRLVADLEIDIAVDLCGFTQGARTELFAGRLAPLQVNYLGFPGTMGADYMDYIIADRHVIPEAAQNCYAEKVAYLPDTYLPIDSALTVAEQTPSRQDLGLPASGFVFCSFNHIFKINPSLFGIWMQLLSAVPGSVLWLSKPGTQAIENLQKEAERRGVDPQRLVFAERVPQCADHLARYRVADLFLDSDIYNAHTTAADALFVGLPVLTCSGATFSARVAGSLLHAIGTPELVTESLEGYKALAIGLARNPDRLRKIRSRLLENRSKHPLFNTPQYTHNLESAFQAMWQRHAAGLPPASFRGEPGPA